MSVSKLTFLLHLRVFFRFAYYVGFRLSGKIYFPTNLDNQESPVINKSLRKQMVVTRIRCWVTLRVVRF